ncbi:MAG: YigZ family protein [Actinomycetaceae bacterium]|nr:YigZ family protein [Actinomycetaceae bacterium]
MDSSGLLTVRSGVDLIHEIEIKRSRFIARIARTDTPAAARALIDEVRATHPQARHNCSAFLIHEDGHSPHQHSSDDGEPAGTAGTPMLEALRAAGTWNVTAVVTRYFGGVLLGAGGLVRAYSSAVSEGLALAPRARLLPLDVWQADVPIDSAGRIEAEMRSLGVEVLSVTWGQVVSLDIGVRNAQKSAAKELLARLTQGGSTFHEVGKKIIEVDEGGAQLYS